MTPPRALHRIPQSASITSIYARARYIGKKFQIFVKQMIISRLTAVIIKFQVFPDFSDLAYYLRYIFRRMFKQVGFINFSSIQRL